MQCLDLYRLSAAGFPYIFVRQNIAGTFSMNNVVSLPAFLSPNPRTFFQWESDVSVLPEIQDGDMETESDGLYSKKVKKIVHF